MKALDYNGLDHLIDKIYDALNSGGSADYIVEEGTSGSWYYRKWASGVAECWCRVTMTVTSWQTWGNVWEGKPYPAFTFPSGLFTAIPSVIATVSQDSSGGVMYEMGQVTQSGIGYIIPIRPISTSVSMQYQYFVQAKGLWKEFTQSVMKSATLDTYYPVGSIYISVSSTFNPNTSFGGTWVKLTNRFLVGAGGNYSLGATGGEATHTLTVNEMPSHSHTNRYQNSSGALSWGYNFTSKGTTSSATEDSGGIGNTGGGAAHNNLPPYQAVNMWQRTA